MLMTSTSREENVSAMIAVLVSEEMEYTNTTFRERLPADVVWDAVVALRT
jgi:hypothetical protein